MTTKHNYVPVEFNAIPDGIRFTTPGHLQGQIVDVAYGDFGRSESCNGSPYKRVTDRSVGPTPKYYRLVEAK